MSRLPPSLEEIRPMVQAYLGLDDEAFEEVFEKATPVKVDPGHELFREGRHNEFVYVIANGKADVLKKKKKISDVGKGDVLGEMSLIGIDRSSATVVASTEMLLYKFTKNWFDILLNRYPQMNKAIVMEAIERRIEQTESPL